MAPKKNSPPEEPTFLDRKPGLFHAITALPPAMLLLYFVPPGTCLIWLLAWNVMRTLLKPSGTAARQLGGHAIALYASHRSLGSDFSDDLESSSYLLSVCGVGLLMGISFRNGMNALLWLVSGLPERPVSSGSGEFPDDRPTVVVSLEQAQATGGGSKGATGAPPNMHGSKLFTVMVQLPLNKPGGSGTAGSFDGLGMVVDEKHSFQSFVDLESDTTGDARAALVRLIATKGCAGGLKGFFQARREGDDLRIFVDRILAQPKGW